jgi:predicted RNA-binding Zn ribbon-like protein
MLLRFGPPCGREREFVPVVVRIAVLGARSAPKRHSHQPRALQEVSRAEPLVGGCCSWLLVRERFLNGEIPIGTVRNAAGLIPSSVRAGFQKSAVPGELDAVAAQARALREWFRSFVQKHKGRPLRQGALKELDPLNRVLARDEAFGQIVALDPEHQRARPPLTWRFERRWRSPDALLLPIASAMADLVCGEDFTQVKACERSPCTLLFVDRTRRHARRWCSMAVCGNRAKQASHRERTRRLEKHGGH